MSAVDERKEALEERKDYEPLRNGHAEPKLQGHAGNGTNGMHHSLTNGGKSANGASSPHDDLLLPSDWPPLTGPIDLQRHDLPHASSKTEWWYINSHLHSTTPSASDPSSPPAAYSFFVAFFRMAIGDNEDGSFRYSHSITWAIVDPATGTYHPSATLDHDTPAALIPIVEDNTWQMDPRLNSAMLEVLRKNAVPLPDRLFAQACTITDEGDMRLTYGDNTLWKDAAGVYHLHLRDSERRLGVEVELRAQKAVQRQAHDGVVKVGVKDEWMFYYFIPRMAVTGQLTLDGRQLQVSGDGWYDHEFGGDLQSARQKRSKGAVAAEAEAGASAEEVRAIKQSSVASSMQDAKTKPDHAWNWLSIQFDNGCELTATHLVNVTSGAVVDNYAIVIHPDSQQSEHHDMQLTAVDSWVSLATTNDYPTRWQLDLPSAQSSLSITSAFARQEFLTLISRPAFYEGRVHVAGTLFGRPVRGVGFVERFGFNTMRSLDTFFRRMSKQVLRALDDYFPHRPSHERVHDLMCRVDAPLNPYKEFSHLMQGLDEQVFYERIVAPIRLITDRGGKSWRSYAALLAVDVVGGNSDRFRRWLPMPEIMHVGSLIVDDIQDKSLTRRGGPSCHVVYGEAIAINAGNYAYFLSPRCLIEHCDPPLTNEQKCRLYDMYFLCLRNGHVGQAFDIHGLDYLIPSLLQHGDTERVLEQRVACTHRLKSAVPAGCLARMGAYVGGGTEQQMEVLGLYFEAVGLAFQIVDDVLNLTGFAGDTKARGEDIVAGKVTYPVAIAMRAGAGGEAGGEERRRDIWQIVQSKTSDMAAVDRCIALIEQNGGVAASYETATRLVGEAWERMDAHIPDSFYKLMLRAFGMYVLERHY